MKAADRAFVRERAGGRCEYCRLAEARAGIARFHVEHVKPLQHMGDDDLENLALACDRCNLYKGTNLNAVDPVSDQIVPVFNPRRDDWDSHFELKEGRIFGRTPVGRAAVRLLHMNDMRRVRLRREGARE